MEEKIQEKQELNVQEIEAKPVLSLLNPCAASPS
jgi:hypothetical protein